jgi:hypothetical protein
MVVTTAEWGWGRLFAETGVVIGCNADGNRLHELVLDVNLCLKLMYYQFLWAMPSRGSIGQNVRNQILSGDEIDHKWKILLHWLPIIRNRWL